MSETSLPDRIRNFEENWIPRRSPRRFLLYLLLTGAVALPIGDHIAATAGDHAGSQASTDLQPAIEREGQKAQDIASKIQTQVNGIADTAHNVDTELAILKKALGELGISVPDGAQPPAAQHHAEQTTTTTHG